MMQRYLKPNKGTTLPADLCFIGVAGARHKSKDNNRHETVLFDSFVCRFKRLIDGRDTRCSQLCNKDPDAFWTAVDGRLCKTRPLQVFVYDATSACTLLGLWHKVDKGIFDLGSVIDSDPPVIIDVQCTIGRLCFIDVRNYFSMPLEDIGTSFGVMQDWYRWLDTENQNEYSEASYRCSVAEKSISAIMSCVRQHDLGRFKKTISMQSMQAFRHRFAPRHSTVRIGDDSSDPCKLTEVVKVYPLIHDDKEIKEFERSANFSGQDECFFVGNVIRSEGFFKGEEDFHLKRNAAWLYGPVYHVDCNSLYPYVMKECKYPYRLVGYNSQASPGHLATLLAKYGVIARVLVETETDTFPVRHRKRTIYATGQFWTTLCGKELDYASRAGYIRKVGYHVCYDMMDLFSAYVDYFFALKCEYKQSGNRAMELIAKMFLNTLQGKFGQRSMRWVDRPDVAPEEGMRWGRWFHVDYDAVERNKHKVVTANILDEHKKEQEVFHYRAIGGKTQEMVEQDEISSSFPAIGSFVTANARAYMASYRALCPERSIIYQGTDSLLLLEPGFRALSSSGSIDKYRLGAFRAKGEYQSCAIRDTQDYQLGHDKVVRGLPKAATMVGERSFVFNQRASLGGMLFSVPGKQITYTTVKRTFAHAYDGGIVGVDGWVTPFHLNYQEDRGDAWEGENVAKPKGPNNQLLPSVEGTASPGDGRQV